MKQSDIISELIFLSPIGVVKSKKAPGGPHYPFYYPARIEIFPQYAPALCGLEENSHIWVVCYYPPRRKPVLKCEPRFVAPGVGERGVFSIRTNNHPNPLGLTMVGLERIEGNSVFVDRLDAYDGTPVLDLKPYYEHDIVFSPRIARITHVDSVLRREVLWDLARQYHQEECVGCALAVRIIGYLESEGLNPQDPSVTVETSGDSCLADTMQGLCRARLANPPRFIYRGDKKTKVRLVFGRQVVTVLALENLSHNVEEILSAPADQLFSCWIDDKNEGEER